MESTDSISKKFQKKRKALAWRKHKIPQGDTTSLTSKAPPVDTSTPTCKAIHWWQTVVPEPRIHMSIVTLRQMLQAQGFLFDEEANGSWIGGPQVYYVYI